MRLADRTVLVTGAGSGIGRETTIRCAEAGATVIATAVDTSGGQETVDIVREADPDGMVEFEQLDVTNKSKFQQIADETADAYGLDCVVNNAGIAGPVQPFTASTARGSWRPRRSTSPGRCPASSSPRRTCGTATGAASSTLPPSAGSDRTRTGRPTRPRRWRSSGRPGRSRTNSGATT